MFKNHPRGLHILFFTEMWERFAYYLMLGIFVLYMTDSERNGLGFDITFGNEIYGWFIALVYLTPFIGGIIADRYLGYRKSIVFGGLTMAAGYLGLGIFSGQGYTSEGATMGSQFGVQGIAVIATLGYTAIGTFIILKITGAILGNRVTDEEEIEGLDLVLHNERGYDL